MLTERRPIRVAVLCSHRAPGLPHLLADRVRFGSTYEVVCAISSEESFEERSVLEDRHVPVEHHPIRTFCTSRGLRVYDDRQAREEYDLATRKLLEGYQPDLVLLTGYLYLVTCPLLAAYPARLLNLHFSDLTLRRPDGRPRFPGLRAVRDALAAGQPETLATVHLVDQDPDGGAPIVLSWPFPASRLVRDARAWNATAMLKAYAFAHQEWMIRAASGPLWSAALDLIHDRLVDLEELAQTDPALVHPCVLDERRRLLPFSTSCCGAGSQAGVVRQAHHALSLSPLGRLRGHPEALESKGDCAADPARQRREEELVDIPFPGGLPWRRP